MSFNPDKQGAGKEQKVSLVCKVDYYFLSFRVYWKVGQPNSAHGTVKCQG